MTQPVNPDSAPEGAQSQYPNLLTVLLDSIPS